MAFCNIFMNFNFRLPSMNFCGCSSPFVGGWNFPPMPRFFNFGGSSLFGCCGNGFLGFGGFSPFMGFNNFTPNYFASYNQGIFRFPNYTPPSNQNLWSGFKPSTNSNQNFTSWANQLSAQNKPNWSNFTPSKTTYSFSSSSSSSSGAKAYSSTSYSKSVSGSVDNSYSRLSKSEAERKAQNDPRLERLNGGQGWSLASSSFRTDIPYAKKGTSEILTKVSKLVGENLVITSALGTAGTASASTPHQIGGYVSHHNAENPKLDIDCRDNAHVKQLAQKLEATGYFSHIHQHATHIDVQIDPSKFNEERLSVVA